MEFINEGFNNLKELVTELEKEDQEKGLFFNWYENTNINLLKLKQ